MIKEAGLVFAGQKFSRKDFSGQKLKYANFSRCTLLECNFKDADCAYANFSNANCYGSNFTGASLYRVNMMEAQLQRTIFKPRDCFGITLTWKCETFKDMEVDDTWLEIWSFMPTLMKLPESFEEHSKKCQGCSTNKVESMCDAGKYLFKKFSDRRPWINRLLEFVTPDRYVKLKAVFDRRNI